MPKLYLLRDTRAALDSAKSSSLLHEGEPYYTTDDQKAHVGTGVDNYVTMAKEGDSSSGYVVADGTSGGQVVKGGVGASDGLTLQATAGTGTSSKIQLKVGDNGAIIAATVLASGNVGIGAGRTNPNYPLDVYQKIGINGTQFIYKPNSYSLVLGSGGNSLGHAAGDTAYYNTFVGFGAGDSVSTGYSNTFIGYDTGGSVTNGNNNTCVGKGAGASLTSSLSNNTLVGTLAGGSSTATSNTAVGYDALNVSAVGSSNVAIGTGAGNDAAGFSNSVYIGSGCKSGNVGNTNEIVIGRGVTGAGYNTTTIGSAATTKSYISGVVISSGLALGYVEKDAGYSMQHEDSVVNCTANTFTVTLTPSSENTGRIVIIKNSGSGVTTVDGFSSELIDGQLTQTLNQWDAITLLCTGTGWLII